MAVEVELLKRGLGQLLNTDHTMQVAVRLVTGGCNTSVGGRMGNVRSMLQLLKNSDTKLHFSLVLDTEAIDINLDVFQNKFQQVIGPQCQRTMWTTRPPAAPIRNR